MLYKQNGALLTLGTVGVLGVIGAFKKRGSTSGPSYRFQSPHENWFEWLSGDERQTPSGNMVAAREITQAEFDIQRAYEDRIWDLLSDNELNEDDSVNLDFGEEMPDHIEVAFLTWATDMGHGIGLGEDGVSWHPKFWEIAKEDEKLNELSQQLMDIDNDREPLPPSIRDYSPGSRNVTKPELVTNIMLLAGAYGWEMDGASTPKEMKKELGKMSKSDLSSLFDIVQTQTSG
jgi:hypothetical protein